MLNNWTEYNGITRLAIANPEFEASNQLHADPKAKGKKAPVLKKGIISWKREALTMKILGM